MYIFKTKECMHYSIICCIAFMLILIKKYYEHIMKLLYTVMRIINENNENDKMMSRKTSSQSFWWRMQEKTIMLVKIDIISFMQNHSCFDSYDCEVKYDLDMFSFTHDCLVPSLDKWLLQFRHNEWNEIRRRATLKRYYSAAGGERCSLCSD